MLEPVIVGAQVDRYGVPIGKNHVIARVLIVGEQPMNLDLRYGDLVPADGAG